MHYVIVGNGVAGTRAALTIRKRHSPRRAKITLISDESDYFFSRTALMYAYMNKLDRRDLEPYEREVYERQQIERLRGRVVDIDAPAHQLTLADGTTVEYDRCLLATGASPRMVDFGGLDNVEDGLVHFVSIQDLDDCERLTWSTQQATVVGGGLIGVEVAECFAHHGLDVTFLVREPYFWPAAFAEEEGEMISDHIRSHGIDLRHDEQMTHIDVDNTGRVQAIETDAGDRFDCQMLAVAIGVVPAVNWMRDVSTPPAIGHGLRVNQAFETTLDDIYGAGDCVEVDLVEDAPPRHEPIWYVARRHGELAARSMLGDNVRYEPPIFYNSSKFFDVEYTTVGEVKDLAPGTKTVYRRMAGKPISQRIVFDDDERVIGFSMLGSRWDHTILIRWIEERRTLDFVRKHLAKAQFDVEFGRTKLSKMSEEVRTL